MSSPQRGSVGEKRKVIKSVLLVADNQLVSKISCIREEIAVGRT